MARKELDKNTIQTILKAQRNEITEYHIYKKLASMIPDRKNSKVLFNIAEDEHKHYEFWKTFTNLEISPSRWMVFKYYWISRIFGLTFGVKLMERGESHAQVNYSELAKRVPNVKSVVEDEEEHEHKLIAMLDEERLKYVGSIVLGLNDALVELTGALAGFTLALQKTSLIAVTGLITGIAASLSMAASEYISTKTEGGDGKDPIKASVYTGIAYILTVLFLVFPYFLFDNVFIPLSIMMMNAILVIALFTYYIYVAMDVPFKKRFFEMAGLSVGVSVLTFLIGLLVRLFLHVEI